MTASIGQCKNTVLCLLDQCLIKVNPPAVTDSTCCLQYVLYYWTMNMMMNPMFSSYLAGNDSFATFIMSPTLQNTTNGVTISDKSSYFINGYICALITILYSGVICNDKFTSEKDFTTDSYSSLTAAAYNKYVIYNTYFNSSSVYSSLSATAQDTAKYAWNTGYRQGCSTTYGYFKVQIYQPIPLYTTTTWILNNTLSLTSSNWTTTNTLITTSGAKLSYLEIVLDIQNYGFSSTNQDIIQIYDSSSSTPLLSMTRCSYSLNTSATSTSKSTKTGAFNNTHNTKNQYTTRFLKISFYNVQYTSSSPSSYRLVVFTHYSADLTSTNFASATNLMVYQRSVVSYMTTLPIITPITLTYGVAPSTYTWVKTPCNPEYTDTSPTKRSVALQQLSCIYAV